MDIACFRLATRYIIIITAITTITTKVSTVHPSNLKK